MRAWRGAAALAVSILITSSSFARPSSGDAIDVVIAADDADAPAMQAVVAELIARLHLAATVRFAQYVNAVEVITPQAGAEPRVARAWIDLSKPDRATLYLVDRDWERVLIRHVRKLPGHDELAREAIGHILETAVDALAHGGRIGIARQEARSEVEGLPPPPPLPRGPQPTVEPVPAPPRAQADSRPRWELGAFYEGELYAHSGVVANGPAGAFYIGSRRGTLRPGGWLTLQFRLPVIVDSAPFGVRLDGVTGRALVAIDVAVGQRLRVRLGAGGGIDAMHVTPRVEGSPGAARGSDETFALVVARVSAGPVWSLSDDLALALIVSCDIDPSGTRYVALVDGFATAVLSPWPARPALSLGVMTQ